MKIEMNEKVRPFSHLPGSSAILPKSFWKVIAFPSLILLRGPSGEKIDIAWKFFERMEHFTLFQDLKRGEIEISGRLGRDFFRLFIRAREKKIHLVVKNAPKEGVQCRITTLLPLLSSQDPLVFSGQEILIDVILQSFSPQSFEHLSLGIHKKMDVDLMRKRGDLKEILPIWFLLSQWVDSLPNTELEGTGLLLNACEEKKAKSDLKGVEKDLIFLFEAGFSSIFVPHLVDENHLGPFEEQKVSEKASAFVLIKEGAKMIRSLFFEQKSRELHLLPHLLPSFVSGRMAQIHCGSLGLLDMEWRGKLPRRVFFSSQETGEMQLVCPKEIQSFRLRRSLQERGRRMKRGEILKMEKGISYFFDRFEK